MLKFLKMFKKKFYPTQPINVGLYLRRSSAEQSSESPKQQRERLEAILNGRGLPRRAVLIYEENTFSRKPVRSQSST